MTIDVQNISKLFKLYRDPTDRLKEALHPFRKKYHEDFYALRDISFTIPKGQCTGIIGMNGSGKSTLLQIISGVLNPTQGAVKVEGRIAALLELGAGFNPEFTGRENIHFQCAIMGYDGIMTKKLLPEIIEFADIGTFIDQPVKTYSSGMYVRLAFSIAINADPDILIVDEALAVGDAYFQAKCLDRIREFKKQGKTLLFVSHDPGAVKTLCDYAFLLNKGQLVDHGEPDQVFDYYNGLIAEKSAALISAKGDLRKRSGNQKVRIDAARIVNSRGQNTETLVSGEQVSIEVDLVANETTSNPTVGILIRDRLGNDIYGTNNHLLEVSFGEFKAGENFRVSYALPLDLGENVYSLTVAVHSDRTHLSENYDWLNKAVVFKVVPGTKNAFIGYCGLKAVVGVRR
jgi:lipopolysaccharide transport system ATP-binding protein